MTEILDVVFLTPAIVKLKSNGVETTVHVSVDIINRKVYRNDQETLSQEVFEYLDRVNSLPDDFFAAPDDITDKAFEAQNNVSDLQEQSLIMEI